MTERLKLKLFFATFGSRKVKCTPARSVRPMDVTEAEWRRLRARVFARDGYTCVYCGAKPPAWKLQADHIVARSRGGASTFENLATACGPCNISKGALALDAWLAAA